MRIALQSKGRLNEKSLELLREAGISIDETGRKLLSRASNFPVEILGIDCPFDILPACLRSVKSIHGIDE